MSYSLFLSVIVTVLVILLLSSLSSLAGYNFSPDDLENAEDKLLAYHRIVEAYKFAYARRSSLGDEDYVDMEPVST